MPAGFRCRLTPWVRQYPVLLLALTCLGLAALAGGQPARAETLTLDVCLRETAEHNPAIIQKRLALEEAAGTRLVFRARALPTLLLGALAGEQGRQTSEDVQVSVTGANGKPKTVNEITPRPSTLFLIGSEALYQPIFDAAIPASLRRGNAELAVARSNFLVTATAELYAARVQFYQALYQQQAVALLRDIAQGLATNVKNQNQFLQAGLSGRQAVLAAQVQQVNFQPQIFLNVGAAETNLTTLLATMGRPLSSKAAPAGSITLAGPWEDGPLNFDAAGMARESRERRPDLLALRAVMRQYTEDANVARGGYYPLVRIYVTGELLPESFVQGQRSSNSVRPEDNTQVSEISPGIREDWNVIDTGTVRGNVRRLQSLRAALAASLHSLEQNIPSDLDLVRAAYTNAAKQRDLYEANLGISADTLDMIKSGIAQGIDSQLEFLDSETAVLNTRLGVLAAQLRMSLAHADYDRVIGGYLRFIPEDAPVKSAATK
jgi:outer membrane protein TolC